MEDTSTFNTHQHLKYDILPNKEEKNHNNIEFVRQLNQNPFFLRQNTQENANNARRTLVKESNIIKNLKISVVKFLKV